MNIEKEPLRKSIKNSNPGISEEGIDIVYERVYNAIKKYNGLENIPKFRFVTIKYSAYDNNIHHRAEITTDDNSYEYEITDLDKLVKFIKDCCPRLYYAIKES